MTNVAERGDLPRIAPETVRVSVLVERLQIDVSLPVDVPVALLIPELVRLRDESGRGDSGGATADDARRRVWVLRRRGSGGRLDADDTLRTAGVGVDELLHLVAERTLSAPTLYDDVVDAAAHLNQSRHQGWTSDAARRVALLAIALATVAWVWLMLSTEDAVQRTVLVALSGAVVVGATAAAAALTRLANQADAGMALGWSVLPIAASAGWVALTPYGDLARAGGCAVLIMLCAAGSRLIGTGTAGYASFAVFFAAAGAILLAHAAGAPAVLAGAAVAVLGTVGCLVVPRARRSATSQPGRQATPVEPSTREIAVPRAAPRPEATPTAPSVVDLKSLMAAELGLRAGRYAGLAVTAGLGAIVTIRAAGVPSWSALTLAWTCVVALLLQAARLVADLERAAVAVPAGVLAVVTALVASSHGVAPAAVGFAVVLVGCAGAAGAGMGPIRMGGRVGAAFEYARYGAFAALVPVAFWLAVGVLGGPR